MYTYMLLALLKTYGEMVINHEPMHYLYLTVVILVMYAIHVNLIVLLIMSHLLHIFLI